MAANNSHFVSTFKCGVDLSEYLNIHIYARDEANDNPSFTFLVYILVTILAISGSVDVASFGEH